MDRRGASTSIYNTDKWSKWRTGHFNTTHGCPRKDVVLEADLIFKVSPRQRRQDVSETDLCKHLV
jgi:hypothetical protein